MPAYVIADLGEITDRDLLREYGKGALETFAAAGARVLHASSKIQVLEGEWPTDRLVLVEFPDMETLQTWYHSHSYQRLVDMRQAATRGGRLIVFEGA